MKKKDLSMDKSFEKKMKEKIYAGIPQNTLNVPKLVFLTILFVLGIWYGVHSYNSKRLCYNASSSLLSFFGCSVNGFFVWMMFMSITEMLYVFG